ncbi:alanine racemase [Aequitasia blattaphilus]|uniref:Alanine racemase n=1 Tax=Aequitasia blattaphilus TaxID=2949332 RepID=A0ABT1E751_9FIRM|nr:alanine racemase [Aequitasia blattaphilus]MCP1101665.1 alanine racemase [Aequitasia blattaphilus]MCR8614305.1 alanine racemase [Aequitasia blattaphilus]
MKEYRRVIAQVDLDAIEWNFEKLYGNVENKTKMMAVIKSDGYGHGAFEVAQTLEAKDCLWGFAVATLDEAVSLRKQGIQKNIMVLGCVFPEQFNDLVKYDIQMTIYTKELGELAAKFALENEAAINAHIKVDSGMGRIGFPCNEAGVADIKTVCQLDGLRILGLFTHFAKADETDKTFTDKQLQNFNGMIRSLGEKGIEFPYYHASNSAGIIDVKEGNYDLVRAGIATYGLYPSEDVKKEQVILKPALTLKSHVIFTKWVEAGTPISYGGTHITQRKTHVATIPVGYGDGYPRSLSNKGHVLIKGKKAPILGRVCMDQFMVDITAIDGVEMFDEVTLVGKDQNECITVETLGDLSGRFNYEFVCCLGKRIPREYLRHGEIINQKDYF